MALFEEKIKKYIQKLLLSRMRILCNHGFYGLLLMHMIYAVDEEVETACTDGKRITFGTDFLDSLTDAELDFVMMHEILHVVLQHCLRGNDRDPENFNIACDIVVNSNILLENNMKSSSITISQYGESMHLAPDGKEGYEYTAEQVYEMLPKQKKKPQAKSGGVAKGRAKHQRATKQENMAPSWDDHSRWGMYEEEDAIRDVWVKRFEDAAESISIRDPSNSRGLLPLFAKRILEELRKAQTDWRTILNDFIQEEVVDYSFSPPDRRFDESPFFLPDFNGKEDMVEDILFMIDTSGSMSDKMITAAYSEVKGAIDQFDGKLKGWLGFFDAAIIEPKPFSNEDEFRVIRPAGGGGTDFQIIFEYVQQHMEKPPASIIILTDGYAPFPQEKLAMGIPVLWLLNNEKVDPPWGKVARISV
jgi:predicted metal-dependent peptidase